ncbi:response regulator [Dyadobacter flavalbus]|uniref:Response regulator n=1 Tax=Dyadobacter flavalbus TaxID=2579942 RepID=A0A5M8QY18_9BACT|nr:response regulator [Dyadobacter flavalbus]KAA6439313.1 response regulator [Dyadobacter flavalbus]
MNTILLIEDNTEIRENMAEILEMANYQVFSADNGKEGLNLALQHRPDLILCDIMMPVLDGYGVLHVVQKNKFLQNIPFIFLTAKSERADVRKGMDLGADDYITKPFEGAELLNAIDRRLKKTAQLRKEFQGNLTGFNDLISISAGESYLEKLKENRSINLYKKKQKIYTEGNHPARLFYVNKGKIKTFRKNEESKELITGLYKEGDFLGYMALLENVTYRETAEALEDSELALIPVAEFEEMIGSNPVVMKRFITLLANNVNEKEDKLLAIAYNSLRKKVADTLIEYYRKYNPLKEENFSIDLSRDNLAAIAGVAKESLIRTLSDFKDENLIAITAGQIQILDYSRLENMYN